MDDAITLGIIIAELVTNAYVHAFPDGVGKIDVALRCLPWRSDVVLTISDNESGLQEAETTRRGMGLVKRLVKQVAAR